MTELENIELGRIFQFTSGPFTGVNHKLVLTYKGVLIVQRLTAGIYQNYALFQDFNETLGTNYTIIYMV